jgi:GTP-binding protein HflX
METKPPIPLAVLVGIQTPEIDHIAHEASLEELGRLVKTLGYEVVGTLSQKRDGTGAASLLGSGKLAELAALTGGTGFVGSMAPPPKSKARQRFEGAAETINPVEPDPDATRKPAFVIVDHELSPSQIRNLERATGAEVLDRTGVIVEIFHRHANTREAKLQVEMARLKYVAPRMRESSAGGGRQQGPGAGESTLNLDRRKIRDRLSELKNQLEAVQRDSDQRRSARRDQLSGGAGRLHQCRKILLDARTHRQPGPGGGQIVRHARHNGAHLAAGNPAARARFRHGRLHQTIATRSGRLIPLHPGGSAGGLATALCGRRIRPDL